MQVIIYEDDIEDYIGYWIGDFDGMEFINTDVIDLFMQNITFKNLNNVMRINFFKLENYVYIMEDTVYVYSMDEKYLDLVLEFINNNTKVFLSYVQQ